VPTPRVLLELIAALVMVVGVIGILAERWRSKRGIGTRVIQFLGVVLLVPVVFILALEQVLSDATAGTLIGALAGYFLSAMGKDEQS
jgi:uncharacterized membrane protein